MVRYFEVEGEETSQSKPSIFKCKNCGAEGDHKTYECPIQIVSGRTLGGVLAHEVPQCLTCGAHDEHSTRSCPIGKTCYTCGMKGHINKVRIARVMPYPVIMCFRRAPIVFRLTWHHLNFLVTVIAVDPYNTR